VHALALQDLARECSTSQISLVSVEGWVALIVFSNSCASLFQVDSCGGSRRRAQLLETATAATVDINQQAEPSVSNSPTDDGSGTLPGSTKQVKQRKLFGDGCYGCYVSMDASTTVRGET
jgi:hypothetical protein